MTDYIDRQAAIDTVMALMPSLTTADGSGQFDAEIYRVQELFVDIGQVLNDLPSAEAEPVKHGRWIIKDNPGTGWYRVTCSECGEDVTSVVPVIGFFPNAKVVWDYCPYCGAKMDAEEGEPHEQN